MIMIECFPLLLLTNLIVIDDVKTQTTKRARWGKLRRLRGFIREHRGKTFTLLSSKFPTRLLNISRHIVIKVRFPNRNLVPSLRLLS